MALESGHGSNPKFIICQIHDRAYYFEDGCPDCNDAVLKAATSLGSIEMTIVEAGVRSMMRDKPNAYTDNMAALLEKIKKLQFALVMSVSHKKFPESE